MPHSKPITPYKDETTGKKQQVERMFDTISGGYDGLNRIISLGIDRSWRRKVVKMAAKENPGAILDIATGTGDLAIAFAKKTAAEKIVGLDLSEGMLNVARQKANALKLGPKIEFIKGDCEALPFTDNCFDAITVSFGIRNFENLQKGLSEIYRVLKKGGQFVVLETSVPTKFPVKQGYDMYTKGILPIIGRLFSKDKGAYTYLSESAAVFPHGKALNNILKKTGFIQVLNKPQTLGVATIYVATK
ncbi:MAG: bifunctional demethylmenaquinone methyltransferase/2-methoxy-6-polyprenyl-1,4-benzoquinol methylase UbiE [Marinirhabdus sp.]